MKKNALHVFLLLVAAAAQAQVDVTLPALRRLHQSTYTNPAFIPEYDVSVGIPVLSGVYTNAAVSGFNIGMVTSSVNDSGNIDLNVLHDKLDKDANGFALYSSLELFHVRFRVRGYSIGISSSLRTQGNMYFSKDLFGLFINGNLPYQGQTIRLGGNDINVLSYAETGISVAREIGRWTVGARVKYLNGFLNIGTENLSLDFTTGKNSWDPLNLKLHGSINTNGLFCLFDTINGQRNTDSTFNFSDLTSFQNNGWGVDLGATYRVLPQLEVHASVIDFGAIGWVSKPYNYNLNTVDITYTGFNNYEQLTDSVAQTRFLDSLQALIKPNVTQEGYTTWLPMRFTAGADYDLSLRDRVGVLLQTRYFRGNYTPAFSLSYTRQAGTNLSLTANYNILNGSYMNIGLGAVVKWGALQAFIVQDDILFYFRPEAGRNMYLRFGFNLVWGRELNPHPRSHGF